MKYPAVSLVSLVIGLVLSAPVFAQPMDYTALENEVTGNACNGVGGRAGFKDAMKKTWAQIRGDQSTGSVAGSRSCTDRAQDATDCCTAGDSDFKRKCEDRFRDASTRQPLAHSQIGAGAPIRWDNPFDDTGDSSGLRAGMTGTKAALFKSSREKDRMSGMCRALSQACKNSCASNPTELAKCNSARTTSDQICVSANTDLLNSDGINPGLAGPGTRPPGGPSPGTNPGGTGPNGGQTQKPQSAGGGGNPMEALGKALQAMNQQQQQPQPQPNPNNDPTQQNCESNPALAGCPVKVDDPWAKKKNGTAEMKEDEGKEAAGGDEFNVADTSATTPGYTGNGEQKFGTPATNATVANGGGQIPGGQGGAAAQAGGATGGYAAASKAATDIMHGMMSGGGYSQMNAAMQMQNGGNGGGFSGYGAQGGDQFKNGMDLRQFLPGGKADPTRKLAGGAASFQIQPQTVNIWSRISERFKARCSQGLLRDCN